MNQFEKSVAKDFSGLIFDCDGTLADTMPVHFVAWSKMLGEYQVSFPEETFYAMAGQPTVSIIEQLLAQQRRTGDPQQMAREKEQAFLKSLDQVKPLHRVVEIAREYRSTHPMGVGSGSNRDVVLKTLDVIGLADFFDGVVGAEDTEKHKPEPDVFLEVARRIQVEPTRCLVFEDADLGIESALRAGMACVDIRDFTIQRPN